VRQVNLAEAKAHLSELAARAAAGEPICIMRRGKPAAQLTAVGARRKRIDPSALRQLPTECRFNRKAPANLSVACATRRVIDALSGYVSRWQP